MSTCSVVVDRNNRIIIAFHESPNGIGSSFLHFWIGTLNSIQFNSGTEGACIRRGYRCTAHPDAVVFTAQNNDFIPSAGCFFSRLIEFSVADSPSLHNDFVVSQSPLIFLMLESKDRTGD